MPIIKKIQLIVLFTLYGLLISLGIRSAYITLGNPELTQTQAFLTTLFIKDYRIK